MISVNDQAERDPSPACYSSEAASVVLCAGNAACRQADLGDARANGELIWRRRRQADLDIVACVISDISATNRHFPLTADFAASVAARPVAARVLSG